MSEISVIVPVYKVEPFLSRCIESILNQTYSDFDLVLVDDGSPDRCGAICDKYAGSDSRIHAIHQANKGLSAARNSGIEWVLIHSSSDWITFVDSDDWLHPKYLEVLHNAAIKDHTKIVIGGALWTNNEDLPEIIDESSIIWKPENYFLRDATNATVSWGKLYSKDFFKRIRFPEGKIHEDEFVTYRLLFNLDIISVVDAPLYAYYQNEDGIIKSKWTVKRLVIFEALEQQIAYFTHKGYEDIARERFKVFLYNVERHRQSLEKCADLNLIQKKHYSNVIRKSLRRILLFYRKYNWLPFQECEYNKQIYMYAFRSIYISRGIWRYIKGGLKTVPITHFIGKKVKEIWKKRDDIKSDIRYIRSTMFCKGILLQTPLHSNLGDHAIAMSEMDYLKDIDFSCYEYPWTAGKEMHFARMTPRHKTVFITGGGYLGQLWPDEEQRFRNTLKSFKNNRIIVFPQTIYFDMESDEGRSCFLESKAYYESHKKLTIFVREKHSLQFMQQYMPKVSAKLAPDMVMRMKYNQTKVARKGCLLCMRKDRERVLSEIEYTALFSLLEKKYGDVVVTDTVLPKSVKLNQREKDVYEMLNDFSSSKLVVTDRLHGMVFSAITETPCIVINSLSPKVEGCYEWLKDLDYICFASSVDQVPVLLRSLEKVIPVYDRKKLDCKYEPLRRCINNRA